MKTTIYVLCVLGILASVSVEVTAAPIYNVNNLGQPVAGWVTNIAGMNDSGVIVGWTTAPDNSRTRGFVFSNGSYRFLDDLGGNTRAYAINNNNQVVGSYISSNLLYAFIYQNDVMSDLGVGERSLAYAINDNGVIVGGRSALYDGNFYWQNGIVTLLPALPSSNFPLGPYAQAYDINNNNVVVGKSHTRDGSIVVRWSNNIVTDLGLGFGQSATTKINNLGVIIGSGTNGCFLYDSGTVSYFDPDFIPANLNDLNQVIGSMSNGGAALYEGSTILNLNNLLATPSESLSVGCAINNQRQIVALGIAGDILLLSPIPEPTTLGLLSFGFLALLRRRRS
jgi:probable HAF family extracellular repeat protein